MMNRKRLIIIFLLVLLGCFSIYKLGVIAYRNYVWNKISKDVDRSSAIITNIILTRGEKQLKTNDLVFVCELRISLWNTGVDIDKIQAEAEKNSIRYKNFSYSVKKEIENNKEIKELTYGTKDLDNSNLIGNLCTLVYPDTGAKRSLYSKYLHNKYDLYNKYDAIQDSIGQVDESKVTQDDLNEYLKAKAAEESFRLKF